MSARPFEHLVILVVDDSPIYGELLGRQIEHLGGTALVAISIIDAKLVLAKRMPHAALVDLVLLDDGNGLDLIRDLRGLYPHLPCILHTSFEPPAGFEDVPYLPKPCEVEDLVAVVLDVIGTKSTNPPPPEETT